MGNARDGFNGLFLCLINVKGGQWLFKRTDSAAETSKVKG